MRSSRFTPISAAVLSLVLVALGPRSSAHATAPPSSVQVEAFEEYFLPSTIALARGGMVTWDFSQATETHTATDASGMGLYDSGLVHPGGPSFTYVFTAAGSYAFVCTLHAGMDGRIDVPMRAAPAHGSTTRTFTVTWSGVDAPDGFVFDVLRRRGGGTWTTWQDGVSTGTLTFVPPSKGTFAFRARLRQVGTSATSGWSDGVQIIVTKPRS